MSKPLPPDIDADEIEAAVCNWYFEGLEPKEIRSRAKERFQIELSGHEPGRIIQRAAENNRIHYQPERHDSLSQKVRERFSYQKGFSLKAAEVVSSLVTGDICQRAADMIMRLLREYARNDTKEVHIGFSGGRTIHQLIRKLSRELRGPVEEREGLRLPETIVWHSLVGGFEVNSVESSPNSMFGYLDHPDIPKNFRNFVLLHAPPVIKPGDRSITLELPGIKEAYQAANKLHLIVTSAASIDDEHSMLYQFYRRYCPGVEKQLRDAGCPGDMLWMPVPAPDKDWPDLSTFPYCALTLKQVSEFPSFIAQGNKHVLLVVGPCVAKEECPALKHEILAAILHRRLATHVVVDSRTARALGL